MVRAIHVLFVLSCGLLGAIWAIYLVYFSTPEGGGPPRLLVWAWIPVGVFLGVVFSAVIIMLLRRVTQDFVEKVMPALVGASIFVMVGFALAWYVNFWVGEITNKQIEELREQEADSATPSARIKIRMAREDLEMKQRFISTCVTVSFVVLFGYIGITLGLTYSTSWQSLVTAMSKRQFPAGNPKLLDTSVIIDGRIADICKTGFIEGTLVIPHFVLTELQSIADSSDNLRRARGRRGLDIVQEMKKSEGLTLEIIEDDPRATGAVDAKLVRLAREINAKIITNDLNLNKVAQIEGVAVLNINDLANSLKPAVLPDEEMRVRIVKEGKENMQGVGYLDDGTMIVVDGGRDHIGREVAALVTSVLQTTAGRMIFTKLVRVVG